MKKRIAAVLVVIAVSGLEGRARGADDFYKMRLQEGRIAYQTGSAAEAADLLRIGCFGLMDQPLLHSEGLAWLALALQKLNRPADLDATLRRFLEMEKRFGVYDRIALPAGTKAELEDVLARRLPPDALRSLPALARLVETEEQKLAKLPPRERRRVLEAKAKAEPESTQWPLLLARLAVEQGDSKAAARWAGRMLELDPANVEALRLSGGPPKDPPAALPQKAPSAEKAPAPAAPDPAKKPDAAPAQVDELKGLARELLKAGNPEKARDVAAAAVAANPEDREGRKLLLEMACMARDWQTVVTQVKALAPFRDGEEPSMFYSAVGLYETGSKEEARPLMRRARPRIASTPFVNYYAEKLLH